MRLAHRESNANGGIAATKKTEGQAMKKRILNVGHCVPDHLAIEAAITQHFDAELVPAENATDTLAKLRAEPFDLVLVNRKLDHDYSDGIEVISQIKNEPQFRTLPVMLITNFSDYQQKAVEAGAVPGFGKQALGTREMIEKLRPHLT